MTRRDLPPIQFLRECFRLDPNTGLLYWRERPEHHFATPAHARGWNRRHAGAEVYLYMDRAGYGHVEMYPNGKKAKWPAHRIVFALSTGNDPDRVDHRDCDPSNNRPNNLRAATGLQNRWNAPGWHKNTLPKGVHYERGRFYAKARPPRSKSALSLGGFATPAAAHAAWCEWARDVHGEFFNPGPLKLTVFD